MIMLEKQGKLTAFLDVFCTCEFVASGFTGGEAEINGHVGCYDCGGFISKKAPSFALARPIQPLLRVV